MLLIPIAQEQSTVRRHPWVSYAIVALCFLVHAGFDLFSGVHEQTEELRRTQHELTEHLVRHPYLVVPSELAPYLPDEMREALGRARDRAVRRGELPPPAQLEAQQSWLAELAKQVVEQIRALPSHRLGYVPARPRPSALLTYMFMHSGWMHLLGNMLFFFLSGPFIEDVYGRWLFAAFYLVSGAVAAGSHALANPEAASALVGASGAVAGVMGAFLVRFGARRIAFLFLPIPILPTIRTRFFMPAYVVLPFWLGQQLLFAHADTDASGVAWWAHVGGFGFGVIVALTVRAIRVEERFINPVIERQIKLEAHPSLERIVDARVAGRLDEAQAELDQVLRSQPDNIDAWIESYELGLARQDPRLIGRAAVRLLELYGRAGESGLAQDLVHDRRWCEIGPVSPQLSFAAGAVLEKEGNIRRALELYADVARLFPKDPKTLRALVRRGELYLKADNLREARHAFESAQAHPAYGSPWNEVVERGLREVARRGGGGASAASMRPIPSDDNPRG
jgi:membrane associated rhomboid family serine protease